MKKRLFFSTIECGERIMSDESDIDIKKIETKLPEKEINNKKVKNNYKNKKKLQKMQKKSTDL